MTRSYDTGKEGITIYADGSILHVDRQDRFTSLDDRFTTVSRDKAARILRRMRKEERKP